MKLLNTLILASCLRAAIGDNAPAVPSTWVQGHPRLGAPTNAQLLTIFNAGGSGILPARYVAAANAWDTTCVNLSCNGTGSMPYYRYLLLSVMACEAGGTSVGNCGTYYTTWAAKVQAMINMGLIWATVQLSDDATTGDGAGHITLSTGSFLTGCGGSCANYNLAYLGYRYQISATGLTATTATITRPYSSDVPQSSNLPYSTAPFPFPNGSGLKIRVMLFPGFNTSPALLYELTYDWYYAKLTTQQRSDMATGISNWLNQMENQFTNLQEYPYNDQFYTNGSASWEGGISVYLGAMAIYPDLGSTGLAHLRWTMDELFNVVLPAWNQVGHDGGWNDSWSDYEVSNSGFGRHAFIVTPFLAWANAGGRGVSNFFTIDYPWLKNWAYWPMYLTRPDFLLVKTTATQTPIYVAETTYSSGGYALYDSMEGLAEIYNDPTIRGWARLTENNASPDGFEPSAFPWYTPDKGANSITNPGGDPRINLPLCRVFRGQESGRVVNGAGWFICRTDWTASATHWWGNFGDNFWSHPQMDAGHFTLYSKGNLAITSGTYVGGSGSLEYGVYSTHSVAKNVLTVRDPNDDGSVYNQRSASVTLPNGTNNCADPSQLLPNEGGQRRIGAFSALQSWNGTTCTGAIVNIYTMKPYDVASWYRGFEFFHKVNLLAAACSPSPCGSTLNYAYLAVDLTPAYNNGLSGSSTQPGYGLMNRSQRVQSYTRHFVFIPDASNAGYLVIFDAVTSTNAAFKKTWRLHTINQPTISGTQATVLRQENARNSPYGLCPAFAYNTGLIPACSAAGGTYQYNGKMTVNMVFPSGGNLCNLGGAGHEFDDGTGTGSACATGNNLNQCQGPPGTTNCGAAGWGLGSTQDYANPQSSAGVIEAGSWRIEESPTASNTTDYFLNVMRVGDAAGTFPATVTGSTSGTGAAATHTATWTNANCTYTITFNDLGVGGSAAATGTGCVHTF